MNPLDKHLTCSICSDIFVDPITIICNHTFCHTCISESAAVNSKCPICRTSFWLPPNDVLNNTLVDIIINTYGEDSYKIKRDERNHKIKIDELKNTIKKEMWRV